MYVVLGNVECEGQFVQVNFSASALRSKGVFLLIDKTSSSVFLWIGRSSNELHKKVF